MDEILENEIKYQETLLRQYIRMSEISGVSSKRQEETINQILDSLSKLYKKRKK